VQTSAPRTIVLPSTDRKNRDLRDNRSRTVVFPVGVGFNLTDKTGMALSVPLIYKESEMVGASDVLNDDASGIGDVSL